MVCDLESELPTADLHHGDLAFAKSSDKLLKRTGTTWVEVTGGPGGPASWGSITGTLSDQTDLQTALNGKEASGTFSGVGACGSNTWASTLNDGAAPTCTQPAFSDLSGAATDAQVPNTITVDLATTATTANAGDSATAFFSSGTLEVARGGTGAAPGADDQVLVADSTSAATWRAVPDCDTAATSKLLYDTATNAFSCGTDQTGGGGGGATVTRLVVTADHVINSASYTDVNGLTLAVTSGTTYSFECHLRGTQSVAGDQFWVAVNGPASTWVGYSQLIFTSATAHTAVSATAYDATAGLPATGATTAGLPHQVKGSLLPSANGTFAVRVRRDAGAGTTTVLRGSYCLVVS